MIEDEVGVVAAGCRSEWALLADRDAVDLGAVAGDFADGVAAVRGDAVAETLLAFSDRDDALRVSVPGNVVDSSRDDLVFACATITLIPRLQYTQQLCNGASWSSGWNPTLVVYAPFVAPSPLQSQTLTVPVTSPLAT